MSKATACICLGAIFSVTAAGQTSQPSPRFLIADVHVSDKTAGPVMRGGLYRGGRYELHGATMLDLVRTAYGFDPDRVTGGPAWVTKDRFEIAASAPADATPDSLKLMLQGLLAERFSLVAHRDTKPVPAYAITVGEKPLLTQADGTGETGCKIQSNTTAAAAAGANIVRANLNGTSVQLNLNEPIPFACRNMTMAAFADGIRTMVGSQAFILNNPVVDQTGLTGKWNFDVKWSLRQGPPNANPVVTIFDAFEKQLGLKLELTKAPFPVIVVDSVNEAPTANLPGVAEKLATQPTAFEVADIKPSMPFSNSGANSGGGRGGMMMQQGGRIDMRSQSVRNLIMTAWNLASPDMLVGGPKSLDTTLFDVDALAPVPELAPGFTSAGGGQIDIDSMRMMLQALLKERFKLAVHEAEMPVQGYELVAAQPTVKKADPANRPGCAEGPAPGEKDPRQTNPAASRLVTCLNMSVAEFAVELKNRAGGYLGQSGPPVDATGLAGKYDFTVNFSPVGPPGGAARAGSITLSDALEKQLGLKLQMGKHPGTALVVDHCEENPTEN